MAKQAMKARQFDQLRTESEQVAAVLKMPGWKLIADEITAQMESIRTILAENTIRTYTETTTSNTGTVTRTTTAETQIAENAGMYKMGQYLFDLTEKIVAAPTEVLALEKKGVLTIEQPPKKKSNGEVIVNE